MDTVSKTEFAKALRLSGGRISQMIQQGLPVNADGRVPLAEATSWYESRIHKSKKKGPKPLADPEQALPLVKSGPTNGKDLPAAVRLLEAQATKEEQLAILRQMEVEERKATLVDLNEIETVWGKIVSATRSRMLNLSDELAARLAVVTDVLECRAIIDREVKAALSSLTEYEQDAA